MRGAVGDQTFEEEALAREGHDTRTFFNSCVWGFGFIRAWVYLMFLGMGVGVLSGAPDSVCLAVYVSSSAALTVTLFAGGFVPHVVERVLTRPAGQVASIAATVLGTICAVGASTLADAPLALLLIGGMATGVGSGLIHLGYGEIHRNRPPADVGIEIPVAVLIAAVVFSAVSFTPFAVQLAVTSALPVASGLIMMRESRRFRACPALVWTDRSSRLIMPTPRLIVRVGACALGIGLADGVARQVFILLTGISSFDFYHPAMLTSSVVLAVLLVGFELLRRDNTFRGLYKLITFTIAASIAFVPSLSNLAGLYWLGPLITLIGYNAFNAFVWILLADLTYDFRLSAAATFGIGWGMLTLGSTAGQMLAAPLGSTVPLTPQLASFLAACGTLVVFAVCLFVMKDDDLVDIVDRQNMVMSVGENMADDEGEYGEGDEESDPYAQALAAGAIIIQHQIGVARTIDEIMDDANIDPADIPHIDPLTPEEAANDPIAQKLAPLVVESKENPPKKKPAPFKERCTKLARDCGLTPRETEILILFAKGRSAARIQEELVISRGTVTTHLQHIYRKVDVHSKQELLDAIEAQK